MLAEFDINKDGKITLDEWMTTLCGEGWVEDDPPGRQATPLKVMVAVDGSALAEKAFYTAARLLRKGDEMIIYHVTNPGRYQEMAASFHPDTIKSEFETHAIKADINMSHKVEFVLEEKKR